MAGVEAGAGNTTGTDILAFPASPSKPKLLSTGMASEYSNLYPIVCVSIAISLGVASITISWGKPHRVGASPLRGYQVEHWAGGRHWVTSQVQEETFTLAPVPDTPAIIFLVRARNEHGLSPPSPLSDPVYTQPDAAPELASAYSGRAKKKSELLKQISDKLVELEEVAVLGSKKVRLSWKVNSQVKHGLIASLIPPGQVAAEHQPAVQGYWLQVAEVGGGGGGGGARTVRVAGGGARSHLLAGLAPATQYSAYLVPHTAGSLARPSRLLLFTTKEDGKLHNVCLMSITTL